jgi:hypothetical protein
MDSQGPLRKSELVLSLSARSEAIAVTLMSRLRRGAHGEGLALVTEDNLLLTSATVAPTVFRRFWPHRFSGGFGLSPIRTDPLAVAVIEVSS